MTKKNETIGFVGIGLMGRPMTLRLLEAGFSVSAWNRDRAKLTPLTTAGAVAVASIGKLTEASSMILLCLSDTAAVESVVFGAGGVAEAAAPGKPVVDLSRIAPEATRQFAARLKRRCSMGWVDAPVSGGITGAEQGTLAIMAGGTKADVDRSRPVLAPLSRKVTHMGEVGSGQVTKICNQMLVGCNALVIAEMIALAKRAGVDAEMIPEALSGGFADSKPLQILGPEMAMEKFTPVKWHVKTLLKDLSMATELSGSHGTSTPMSALAAQLMQLHATRGFLEQDLSTLIKLYRGQ
ncbi:MAG: NAD(P)-dependent oxidoreductase [Pseudomonadota bacterium]